MITHPYQYIRTYIGLHVDTALFRHFPETVEWAGGALLKKDDFHMTICKGEDIFAEAHRQSGIGIPQAEEKLLILFNRFTERTPILLSKYVHDFRYVEDDTRERKTIIVRCTATNLNEFFAELNKEFNINIPLQPVHITLYTLQKNVGIHISNKTTMDSLQRVSLPTLDRAYATIKTF